MRAEPEDVAHRRVNLVPVTARGHDGVVGAAAAQRAVGQFGSERRVAAGQPAFFEQGGKQQVGVGVAVRDRAQDVVRGAAGRIDAGPGLAAGRLVGAGSGPGWPVRAGPAILAKPHGAAGVQTAGPVRGGHAALARGLDLAEAYRAGAGADEYLVAADLQLTGRQVPGLGRAGTPGTPGRA